MILKCQSTSCDPGITKHQLKNYQQKKELTESTTERPTIMSTTTTNTIRLHRVLRATPERIYRAFLDADAMVKWLPPNGFTGKVHQMDAKVGGTYKMSFTNFTTGKSHSFGGTYVELKPHERIRYTDKFDDPALPGEMQTTITLTKVSCGTDLNIVQKVCRPLFPPKRAISAGRSRSRFLRNYWNPRFQV